MAVLDELAIGQAHFVGMSWGGRLAFGVGQHAPERVLSLVVLGQQPYGWPDSPLTRAVTEGLVVSRTRGAVGVVEALEAFWGVQFPNPRRARWLDNDPTALEAAWTTVLAEGPVSDNLRAWRVPCLICIGSADADFIDQARQAAAEIPGRDSWRSPPQTTTRPMSVRTRSSSMRSSKCCGYVVERDGETR